MVADPCAPFADRLRELVAEDRMERAGALTRLYWTKYTGRWFHVLADHEHPNEITVQDLVAVAMLSVNVPAPVVVWLLNDPGRAAVTELLGEVPNDVDLQDGGDLIDDGSPLRRLWTLLQTGCWPEPIAGNGMGLARISKLLAAKRPRLVPVLDSVVCGLFRGIPVPDYWRCFHRVMSDPEDRLVLSIASASGAPEDTSLLRRLDAMLWMIGKQDRW